MGSTEKMETESTLGSFNNNALFGLAEAIGISDPEEIVSRGLNVEFCKFIRTICLEISGLHQMTDVLSTVDEESEIEGFLFELSAFLGELDCPYELITCGPLQTRLNSRDKIELLLEYLLGELKAARLTAFARLQQPLSIQHSSKPFIGLLKTSVEALNATEVLSSSNPLEIISELRRKVDSRIRACYERPKPLFTASMDNKKWANVDQLVQTLSQDCRSRNLLLMKRIDVTINSFLWSDRVKKNEGIIRKLFADRRVEMSQVANADASGLLAASSDLLRVEHVSNLRRRQHTRSKVHPLAISAPPVDRGGRTNEMNRLNNESFASQTKQQHSRGRGGGYHPRSQQQHGGSNQPRSLEQQVRGEFEQRDGAGRGRGNFQRGRGRGRGHY